MVRLGRDRYRSETSRLRSEGKETLTPGGRQLLRGTLKKLYAAVKDWQELSATGKAGPWHKTAELVAGIAPGIVALTAARVILDEIREPRSAMTVAGQIGRAIEEEAQLVRVKEEEPWLAELLAKKWHWGRRSDEADELLKIAQDRGWRRDPWNLKQRRAVGQVCIALMIAHTGLIERIRVDRRLRLVVTDKAMLWMAEADEFHELRRPMLMPTPHPPRPWEDLEGGGYSENILLARPLVKKRKVNVSAADIPDLLTAVNHVQDTRWSVNRDVLQTVLQVRELGLELGGVLASEDEELPPFQKYLDETRKAAISRLRRGIHRRNSSRRGRRLFLHRLLFAVDLIKDLQVYMPHQVDFRGRLFAMPTPSAMGTDLERGLLHFGEPKAVGDSAKWLEVHGANMWGHGLGRKTFDDRQQWIATHVEEIKAVAADPLEARFWSDADEPIQFLAFCQDYAGYLDAGPAHQSSLVCFADGVCNGIQIYAMLLRDQKLAKLTCCTSDPARHDIYEYVAQKMTMHLTDSALETDAEWLRVLGGSIPRELVKTPVLAMVYGATEYGQMQFIVDWFEAQEDLIHPWKDRYFFPCKRLAEVLRKVVDFELIRAVCCADWFRRASRRVVRRDADLIWTAPNGLVVDGTYHKRKSVRIDAAFQTIRLRYDEEGEIEKLDRVRSARSMAAHFVHSCDSTALHLAVCGMRAHGIDSLATVHDCLGVRAADYAMAGKCVRRAYSETFSGNLLRGLHSQLQILAPDAEIPFPSGHGMYDPKEVIDAPYFWS